VQDELLAQVRVLAEFGPNLGRPRVDTLNGSQHANMKELRFDAGDGAWRVAFAFDPKRCAILLVADDQSGGSQKRFYKRHLQKLDFWHDFQGFQLDYWKGLKNSFVRLTNGLMHT
jgi:hypothetical protein